MAKCKKHPDEDLQIGQTARGMNYVFCAKCKAAKRTTPATEGKGVKKAKADKTGKGGASTPAPAAAAAAGTGDQPRKSGSGFRLGNFFGGDE